MTTVLLTADGLEHRYVAGVLADAIPDLEIHAETRSGGGGGLRRKLRRWSRRGPGCVLDKVAREAFRRITRDAARRRSDLERVLGARRPVDAALEGTRFVPSVNDEAIRRVGRESRPKLALVYGTGLVRRETLESFDCPILNLHTGLSPYYRGVACHFWPLIDGRPDRVGVTVHDCVAELDAGGILATAVAAPEPGDSVHATFARQVVVGADLYARMATACLAGTPPREMQDLTLGREYRGVELGFLAEWRARRGLRRLPRTVSAD